MKVIDSCQAPLLPSEILELLDLKLVTSGPVSEFTRRKAIVHAKLAEYLGGSESPDLVDNLVSLGLSNEVVARLVNLRSLAKFPLIGLYVDHVLRAARPGHVPTEDQVREITEVLANPPAQVTHKRIKFL
jgi:hypothetical protein